SPRSGNPKHSAQVKAGHGDPLVTLTVFQPIWRGRLSGGRLLRSGRDTLEPERPGSGFEIKANWPGLVLVALGGAFLLAGAVI
ncbi:hypothetical protein AAFX91_21325, partial [Bradyrhizobium sp. 31Argb]|uniref:hypothetical protein n=1 Tax=Bradyrhizobium sp. 31Argb TaxID=3141247 RepID=UPI003747D6A8